MPYEIDYLSAESEMCSSKLVLDDRVFYVKLLSSPEGSVKYFVADPNGVLKKEISKSEFELWLNILTESESDIKDILEKVNRGKKY